MRRLDLLECFGVGKVEAIAQVNHGAQHRGMFDMAPAPSAFHCGPTFRPRITVFPKIKAVAKPVPWILTEPKGIFQRNDLSCDTHIATVIPDNEGMGNHQRNCGFNLPVAVYMPVAARKRRMDFLSAAMRLPVARNWRTSASAAVAPLAGLLKTVFTTQPCHQLLRGTTILETIRCARMVAV